MTTKPHLVHLTLFVSAAFLLSLYFANIHIFLCVEAQRASLALLLADMADTPFQYRVLIPWLVNLIMDIPVPLLDSPNRIFWVTELAFTFLLSLAFRLYLSLFIQNQLRCSVYALSIFLILPYQYVFYSLSLEAIFYPSDIPSIFFFTLGLILIYRKNWFLYYPVFIAATFNRETTIFLVFIYWMTAISTERMASVMLHCLIQITLWVFVKQFLGLMYADNPGPGFFINFLLINGLTLMNPINAIRFSSNFCFIWIPVLFCFGLIRDMFIRKSVMVVFPFFAGMAIVGNIIEMRIYGEMIPVVLSAFLLIVDNLLFTSSKKESL